MALAPTPLPHAVDDALLASVARHGGRFLTATLNQQLGSRVSRVALKNAERPFAFLDQDGLRAALAGRWPVVDVGTPFVPKEHSVGPAEAWTAIDGELFPGLLASVHIAEQRAHGRDRSRPELLDEAITWPIIRIALGLPL